MAQHITLSTRSGYPSTYVSSETLTIVGSDAFISLDFSKGERTPVVTLVGTTIGTRTAEPKRVINVGDTVSIGDVTYELVSKRTRFIGNGDLKLVPAK